MHEDPALGLLICRPLCKDLETDIVICPLCEDLETGLVICPLCEDLETDLVICPLCEDLETALMTCPLCNDLETGLMVCPLCEDLQTGLLISRLLCDGLATDLICSLSEVPETVPVERTDLMMMSRLPWVGRGHGRWEGTGHWTH